MRRLLYLAVVLVFLAITGLAMVRVVESEEFISRRRLMQVEIGMTRDQVRSQMSTPPIVDDPEYPLADVWRIGDLHWLIVSYGTEQDVAVEKRLERLAFDEGVLGRLLEAAGFPKAADSQRGMSSFEFKHLARSRTCWRRDRVIRHQGNA